jgi:diguanylate cyclase (GGDEF)-like protein
MIGNAYGIAWSSFFNRFKGKYNFKSVNNRFGHQKGDEIIINLAGMINRMARETDFVGRYGGEEFLVIMPDTDLDSAYNYCKRLQESSKTLVLPDNSVVTFSGGVVQYEGEIIEELIQKVDTKLYYAENNGKNQFVCNKDII